MLARRQSFLESEVIAHLRSIPGRLDPRILFTAMPGKFFSQDRMSDLGQAWLDVTGRVSVPIPHGTMDGEIERVDHKWASAIRVARESGASGVTVRWEPWMRYTKPHSFTDAGKANGATIFDEALAANEGSYWYDRLHAISAATMWTEEVIGFADTECWDWRWGESAAAGMTRRYRETETLWKWVFGDGPNYWYDLGGMRRAKSSEGVTAWEPSTLFPPDYPPAPEGRAAPPVYHFSDPAEFSARLEAIYRQRAKFGAFSPPPKYAVCITFGQSSDDGRPYQRRDWPTRYTAAAAAQLRELMDGPGAWIERIIVWMDTLPNNSSDWEVPQVTKHLAAFDAGWRLFDASPTEATKAVA